MPARKHDEDDDPEVIEEDPSKNKAVTGRPNDLKIEERKPALPNSTLGTRSKERAKADKAENKRVSDDDVERK